MRAGRAAVNAGRPPPRCARSGRADTGEERYLAYARAGVAWLREHAYERDTGSAVSYWIAGAPGPRRTRGMLRWVLADGDTPGDARREELVPQLDQINAYCCCSRR